MRHIKQLQITLAVILSILFSVILSIILILYVADRASGQTAPKATHVCTVGETQANVTSVDCGDFLLAIGDPWPAAWKGKGKGDQVFVHTETFDGLRQALPVAGPIAELESKPAQLTCRERIRRAFFQHADGSLARGSVSVITPADCVDIPEREREQYTKEP